MTMASLPEAVTLKEFCPLYSILNAIPAKVQKGFRSVLVYLTALDANGDYIAVGSSIGMLYLYCRHTNQMRKYNLEGKTESISVVKLLSCFDDLVAVGMVSGRVAVFQLVSPLPGRNKQLRRFDVLGVHKSSITALAWSPNGMKLFSGDNRGKIIQSDLNFDKGSCNSSLILEEMSSIVQLDYSHKVLLISTTQRCLLFYTEEKAVKQVGNQPRKSNGRYGACFIPGLCKQSDLTLFASRPGLRLWKADVHGSVHSTFLLKDVLSQTMESIELYPRVEVSNGGKFMLSEKHLGHLSCFLHEGWVLSWDEYSIYVMDTINQAVIGGLESSGDIVSVSCTNNEIFLLKGDREIIRISDMPEGSVSAVIHSPFRSYTAISAVKGNNQNGTLSDDNSKDVEKIKTEKIQLCVDDGENALELLTESRNRSWSLTDDVISRRSSMNSVDSGCSLNAAGEQMGFANELKEQRPISQRFSTISNDDFDQELIVKSIKVKKKKKKRPENGFKSLESGSLYRTPSTDSPLTVSSDCFSASESLPGGSAEHLSSQESLLSGKPQSIIDDSCLDVFNTLQLTEPAALVPLDETEQIDNNSRRILDIAEQYELIIPPVTLSTINPETTNVLQPEESVSYKSTNVSTDAERVYIHDQPALEEYADNKRTLDNYDLSTGIESHITSREEDQMSLEFKKDSNEGVIEDPLLQESCTKCQLSSSFIGEYKQRENFNSWDSKKATKVWETERDNQDHMVASSDDEDIYVRRLPYSSSDTNVAEMGELVSSQDINSFSLEEPALLKSEQLSESWMVYSGPGNGIFALAVSEKYIWCLDYKGSLYCSALPGAGLRWQKFEDAVQQVAVSPSGALLWKIEHKSNKAFACGKVTIKGKRHWYEALPQAAFVALSDDTAWIIRTNGDLYLQTGLSVDRPCARAVKVDCPCPLSQITARNNVVWALTEQRGLLYMEGVSSLSPEGEVWKCDLVSERQALEPVCVTLGDQETVWTLDSSGNLWFRTGVTPKKPQGEDEHWWQVSITDYVVFDHYTLFQTLIQATQTVATVAQAPVEKVADKLRMTFWSQQSQCQPSLLGVNSSGVWITSGKNEFHVAKGNLIGTFWQNFVPRGTASTTKWASVSASASPTAEGCVLWICQSRKDLFCLNDLNPPYRPSTVQLPPETEIVHLSACSDAVWALDHHGGVYIRTLSKTCLTGMHWTKLDLSQLGHVKLCSFSCGNQHIWACDTSGIVYFRVGTQPLNPSMMLPAWIMIEPPIQPVGFNLVAVYSSPNDHMLWTLDNKYNVYVRIGITEEMPVGIDWEHVPGLQACQLAVSARTVWARCPNGDIARRYGITEKNAAGDYWKKIPGNVTWLTVTAMDELWAVGPTGQLLQRLTKTYSHYSNIPKNDSLLVHSDFEDEWEVI